MNANYFLFATLEQARPIAQARGTDDKARLTVLTGTPVAGMVYLDRPSPAGYFIFPDLSVRHEGVYRLSFSLYEELKNEKDDDKTGDASTADAAGEAHVTHRMEVKSMPFIVFSAKKFPGLTESTSLSRMVAEQGCRVRIRRDVRMRRRDAKNGGGKEWDDYEEDTAQARARMSATPEGSGYPTLPAPHGFIDPIGRPRSASNASHQSLANPLSRRTSLQEMNQSYHQPFGTGPHTPQHVYGQSSPYGPSPSQQFSQPHYMQQSPAMQPPPPPQYHPQSYQAPPAMPAPAPPQQSYYGYAPAPPPAPVSQSQYAPSSEQPLHAQRMSMEYPAHVQSDNSRSSTQYSGPTPLPATSYAQQASYQPYPPPPQSYQLPPPPLQQPMYPSQHGQQQSFGSQDPYNRPPALQPMHPPVQTSAPVAPLTGRPAFEPRSTTSLPPLHMPADMASRLEPSSPSTAAPQNSYFSTTTTPIDGHKRSYGSVFSDRHLSGPLRQGARPCTPGYGQNPTHTGVTNAFTEADDGDNADGDVHTLDTKMKYRRADGRPITRTLPSYTAERP